EFQQFLLSAGKVAGAFICDVADLEELDHLVGARAHRFLALAHPGAVKPRVPELFAGLLGRDHHQVLAHRQGGEFMRDLEGAQQDRKSTRLNSSHVKISYAVFCLKKKKRKKETKEAVISYYRTCSRSVMVAEQCV